MERDKLDDNLPGNKAYIKKFYKKSEEEIKKQEGEGRVSGSSAGKCPKER